MNDIECFILFNFYSFCSANAIYTSEKHGSDETGDGTQAKPFKTVARVNSCL